MLEFDSVWSHTPWEMTHNKEGGDLVSHYVGQQIKGCADVSFLISLED